MIVLEEPVSQRIKNIIDDFEEGVQRRFALKIGANPTTISEIFGKRQNKPSVELLQKIADAYPQLRPEWLLLGEGEMLKSTNANTEPQKTSPYTAPFDVHAVGFLGDFPIVELPFVSFKARASFVELGGADVSAGNFERVMHRCGIDDQGNQRTPADYADAIVFEVDGDSMVPSMQSGQKVIAWPIPEGKWEHLHNTACVVAYDDTVTVKAILENDLFVNNRLTLRATKPGGGYFVVGRSHIHSIWEVREFFGVVPYRLFQ
jgi:transcriptional regulator with XRE-family HTH domain